MISRRVKSEQKVEEQRSDAHYLWLAGILLPILTILWFAISQCIFMYSNRDIESAAQRGDMFGAVNALFSAWAFAGVIIAILMQRSELKIQRQVVAATNEELKRAADAQKLSEGAFQKQVRSQFLTAYLNALTEVRNSPPITMQSLVQRQNYDRLSQVVDALEKDLEEHLDFELTTTDRGQHVWECLEQIVAQLTDLQGGLSGADDARIVSNTHSVQFRDIALAFGKVTSAEHLNALGVTFLDSGAVEWIFQASDNTTSYQELRALLNSARQSASEYMSQLAQAK